MHTVFPSGCELTVVEGYIFGGDRFFFQEHANSSSFNRQLFLAGGSIGVPIQRNGKAYSLAVDRNLYRAIDNT